MKTGKYGEPWFVDFGNCVRTTEGRSPAAHRIIECGNALAGRDPAALDGLVEAVTNLKRNARHMNSLGTEWKVSGDDLAAVEAALAAFQGGGTDGQ